MDDPFLLLRQGQIERVVELIESGCVNINQTRWSGFTLLHRSAEMGCSELCEYLVRKGANVNLRTAKGWYTPLHIALGNGYFETGMTLVDLGADPFRKNKYGENPLEFSAKRGYKDAVDNFRQKVSKKEVTKTAIRFMSESRD